MANNEILGESECLLCGYEITIKESQGGKAYYTCGGCQCQHFGRGIKSDQLLRNLAKTVVPIVESETQETEKDVGWFG